MSNKLIKTKFNDKENNPREVDIVVDKNLKRSKVLEEMGLLDGVTGELSPKEAEKADSLFMGAALDCILNNVIMESPLLHIIIAGFYTIRALDADLWKILDDAANNNSLNASVIKLVAMRYDEKQNTYYEFPLCLKMTLEMLDDMIEENAMHFFSALIKDMTKNVKPLKKEDAGKILLVFKHINDHAPEFWNSCV